MIQNKQWSIQEAIMKIRELEFKKKLCIVQSGNTLYYKNWCDYSASEIKSKGDDFCS